MPYVPVAKVFWPNFFRISLLVKSSDWTWVRRPLDGHMTSKSDTIHPNPKPKCENLSRC